MSHDVFICYDEMDRNIARQVCDVLEKNKLSCWLKSRDVKVNEVSEAKKAINDAQVMVVIQSKNIYSSNFVFNEVDIAFSKKKEILLFKIDDSELEGPLTFFFENKPKISAFPKPEDKFDELVEKVKDQISLFTKYKTPIIVAIIIIIMAVIGAFAFTSLNDSGGSGTDIEITPGDVKLNITDFHVDDVRNQTTSWNYSYFVGGTISQDLGNSDKYRIVVDFYDQSGVLVDSSETVIADAQKIGDGYLLGSTTSDTNNIKRVEVELLNGDDVVIAQDESQL